MSSRPGAGRPAGPLGAEDPRVGEPTELLGPHAVLEPGPGIGRAQGARGEVDQGAVLEHDDLAHQRRLHDVAGVDVLLRVEVDGPRQPVLGGASRRDHDRRRPVAVPVPQERPGGGERLLLGHHRCTFLRLLRPVRWPRPVSGALPGRGASGGAVALPALSRLLVRHVLDLHAFFEVRQSAALAVEEDHAVAVVDDVEDVRGIAAADVDDAPGALAARVHVVDDVVVASDVLELRAGIAEPCRARPLRVLQRGRVGGHSVEAFVDRFDVLRAVLGVARLAGPVDVLEPRVLVVQELRFLRRGHRTLVEGLALDVGGGLGEALPLAAVLCRVLGGLLRRVLARALDAGLGARAAAVGGQRHQDVADEPAARLVAVRAPSAAEQDAGQPLGVRGHVDQSGGRRVEVGQVLGGVGHVVRVVRVQAADELQHVGAGAYEAAGEVLDLDWRGLEEVAAVALHTVGEVRFGGGEGGRGADLGLGLARHRVALLAGRAEDLLGVVLVTGARVDEGVGGHGRLARVAVAVDQFLVAGQVLVVLVDLRVVRGRRLLARLGALLPQPDGLLGLALRPVDGEGVVLQRVGRVLAGGGGLGPLGGLRGELRPEGLGAVAVPAARVEVGQAGVAGVEGGVEAAQVPGDLADLVGVAVDQLLGLLGLAELLLVDMGAEVVGDGVAVVVDPVRRIVQADVVEAVTDEVGAVVDQLAGLLLGFAKQFLATVADLVDQASEAHQPTPAVLLRGAGSAAGPLVTV
ncbi:hypothetical protein SBRY_11334 [Actinacidiphila bryophytorum]|uniref:Uncharacterized protein n=1 Tax=Actinacidiphila bryophytorum TaxID=1436133 RepID=A0A9W4E7S7_9ACTN|nr:hypothetical protein SBRY_11334 [Actinacidiphila bryophytorum]